MDGPNVKWKFFRDLFQEHRGEDEELPDLLNIWSCGLHIVRGSFQNWSKRIWMGNCQHNAFIVANFSWCSS